MAASVILNTASHFSSGADAYSSAMYQGFPGYDSFSSDGQQNYAYHAEQPRIQYASSDGWASQANTMRRHSSKSPSMQHDRTPIRHHKPSLSRSRSVSKSEALLAYATEHSVQAQHPAGTTPPLPQTTSSTSPGMFHSQAYTSPSLPSSYSHQGSFYDNPSPPFQDLPGPPGAHSQGLPEYLASNRTDLQMQPLLGPSMNSHEALYLQGQAAIRQPSITALQPAPMGFAPLPRPLESTSGGMEVPHSRNKPQCWDHGCNGRQFSTFSNLLRHQREKSGTAAKAKCPHCGTEFTRTTARNGHMYGGKCKGMPDPSRRSPGSADGHSDIEVQLQR